MALVISVTALAVDGENPASANAVAAAAGLCPGGARRRRVDATDRLLRDPSERDPPYRSAVPDHGPLRDPDPGRAGFSRRRLGHHVELGNDALLGRERRGAVAGRLVVVRPAGPCLAFLGTGLALLNFGIDEYANPRLRLAGLRQAPGRRAAGAGTGKPAP